MCLRNEKNEGEAFKYAWKGFCEKDGELVAIKSAYPNVGKLDGEWKTCEYGFHGFIKKEDAEIFIKTIEEYRKLYSDILSEGKLSVKKVEIKDIVAWGFNIRKKEDYDYLADWTNKSPEVNALRFKSMRIVN